MMKRFCILIVAVMTVTAVLGQSADQWLKQGNDYRGWQSGRTV